MMMNICQEYNFSMESLLLRYNRPSHFCSKDTHVLTFLLINLFHSISVAVFHNSELRQNLYLEQCCNPGPK